MNAELIGIIANISLALSLIVALVFGISQVRAAGRDRRERLTLETLRFFGSREFAELLQYVETHPAPKSRPDLRTRPAAEQTMIIQQLRGSTAVESLGSSVFRRLLAEVNM